MLPSGGLMARRRLRPHAVTFIIESDSRPSHDQGQGIAGIAIAIFFFQSMYALRAIRSLIQ
jgi:hypothetical protein